MYIQKQRINLVQKHTTTVFFKAITYRALSPSPAIQIRWLACRFNRHRLAALIVNRVGTPTTQGLSCSLLTAWTVTSSRVLVCTPGEGRQASPLQPPTVPAIPSVDLSIRRETKPTPSPLLQDTPLLDRQPIKQRQTHSGTRSLSLISAERSPTQTPWVLLPL